VDRKSAIEHGGMIRRHPRALAGAVAYGAVVAYVLLMPDPFGSWSDSMRERMAGLAREERWMLEAAFAAVLFVPLGVLLALVLGDRWGAVILLALIASCWFELAQAVWLPERQPGIAAVAGHVAGAGVGAAIHIIATRRSSVADEGTPAS
jgi:glycopeptide antibiotics resistance protein